MADVEAGTPAEVAASPLAGTSSHHISRIGIHSGGAPLQARLAVGPTDCPEEAEAERISEQVMRGSGPAVDEASAPVVHRSAASAVHNPSFDAEPVVRAGTGGGGLPLLPADRAFYEQRLGHDFGAVRVHSDQRAATSAQTLGAEAYTVGTDVVFGAGRYAPESDEGRRLIAHELVHVVQQGGAARQPVRRQRAEPQRPSRPAPRKPAGRPGGSATRYSGYRLITPGAFPRDCDNININMAPVLDHTIAQFPENGRDPLRNSDAFRGYFDPAKWCAKDFLYRLASQPASLRTTSVTVNTDGPRGTLAATVELKPRIVKEEAQDVGMAMPDSSKTTSRQATTHTDRETTAGTLSAEGQTANTFGASLNGEVGATAGEPGASVGGKVGGGLSYSHEQSTTATASTEQQHTNERASTDETVTETRSSAAGMHALKMDFDLEWEISVSYVFKESSFGAFMSRMIHNEPTTKRTVTTTTSRHTMLVPSLYCTSEPGK